MAYDPNNLEDSPLYPWFGSKRKIASEIWSALGEVDNYVEPFLGTAAVLLSRPDPYGVETVNDLDCMIANFWRAVRANPNEVAKHSEWPISEVDLEARHAWLVKRKQPLRDLLANPEWNDPQIAGWWVWGQCCWIGSGWCSGKGPWLVGKQGWENTPGGGGVNRQRPHLRNKGVGVNAAGNRRNLLIKLGMISKRLEHVRVCCGDWKRVLTPSVTFAHGVSGIVLDPPYTDLADRDANCYAEDCLKVGHDVREWCIEHGDDRRLRIALCGYDDEHNMPDTWTVMKWEADGGYSHFSTQEDQGKINRVRERVWFSPHCQKPDSLRQGKLFSMTTR